MRRKIIIFLVISILIEYCYNFSCAVELDIPVWNSQSKSVEDTSRAQENIKSNSNVIESKEEHNANAVLTGSSVIEKKDEFNTNAVLTSSMADENTNVQRNDVNVIKTNTDNLVGNQKLKTTTYTVNDNPLKLTCGGGILIEQNSGNILYDCNMHEKLRPASVTKIMSILLIMEALDSGQINLSDKVPCTEDASKMGGSQIWLDTTEELSVEEMLKAICVVSANDCTVAMADYLAGSQESFVNKMNDKAKELGMNDTTFKNCHGIDEDGHLTSAYDIAIMSRELLLNHPDIKKYTTIYMDSLRDGKSQLVNTNKLVRNYEGCTGLKTGSTSIALFNLSASATRDNLSLIAVIMKGETSKIRFNEASKLLNYGFGNYQYKQLASKTDTVGECTINKGVKKSANAYFEKDFGVIIPKSSKQEVEQEIEIYNNIYAPIQSGQKVGEVTYKINGEEIEKVNLITIESIEKFGFSSMTSNIYQLWFTLLRKS